jgi:hypothetical protein
MSGLLPVNNSYSTNSLEPRHLLLNSEAVSAHTSAYLSTTIPDMAFQTFQFLGLPVELRLRMYGQAIPFTARHILRRADASALQKYWLTNATGALESAITITITIIKPVLSINLLTVCGAVHNAVLPAIARLNVTSTPSRSTTSSTLRS